MLEGKKREIKKEKREKRWGHAVYRGGWVGGWVEGRRERGGSRVRKERESKSEREKRDANEGLHNGHGCGMYGGKDSVFQRTKTRRWLMNSPCGSMSMSVRAIHPPLFNRGHGQHHHLDQSSFSFLPTLDEQRRLYRVRMARSASAGLFKQMAAVQKGERKRKM